jgi:hypothetical protein
MRQTMAHLYIALCTLLLSGCTYVISPEAAQPVVAPPETVINSERYRVNDVALLGVITIPNATNVEDTVVGGLSAIAYDQEGDTYYFLSDDRGITGPVRLYQATIDLSDGTLDNGDLAWTGMIPLVDRTGMPFAPGTLDPEGLVYTGEQFYVASEGDAGAQPPIPPALMEFTPDGELVESLPLPEKFIPQADGSRGVRANKALESLTRTPDGRYLITGVENALVQDGPATTLKDESPSRLLTIDLSNNSPAAEYVYVVDAIPVAPEPANGDADNGLAELIVLDNGGTLLALERSYAEGMGNTIRLYMASTQDTLDVSQIEALSEIDAPVAKELLVDFGKLGSDRGIAPDNLEGMALGPQLPDGRQLLIMVSDNNFSPNQTMQVWALALSIETIAETTTELPAPTATP